MGVFCGVLGVLGPFWTGFGQVVDQLCSEWAINSTKGARDLPKGAKKGSKRGHQAAPKDDQDPPKTPK